MRSRRRFLQAAAAALIAAHSAISRPHELVVSERAHGPVWYVDDYNKTPGDGESWRTSCHLDYAVQHARPGDTIFVYSGLKLS